MKDGSINCLEMTSMVNVKELNIYTKDSVTCEFDTLSFYVCNSLQNQNLTFSIQMQVK